MKEVNIVTVVSASRQKVLEKALASRGLTFHCIRRDAFSGLAEVLLRLRRGDRVLAIFEADQLDRDEITVFSVLAARENVRTIAWLPTGRSQKRDKVLSLGAHQAVTDLADIQLPSWRPTTPAGKPKEILASTQDNIIPTVAAEPVTPEPIFPPAAKIAMPPLPPIPARAASAPAKPAGSGLEGMRLMMEKSSEKDMAAAEMMEDSVKDSLAKLRRKAPGDNGNQNHDPAMKSLSLLQELARRYRPMRVRPVPPDNAASSPATPPTASTPTGQTDHSLSQDELNTLLGPQNTNTQQP